MGTNDSLPEKTQIVNAYLYNDTGGIVFDKEGCTTITALTNYLQELEMITSAMIRRLLEDLQLYKHSRSRLRWGRDLSSSGVKFRGFTSTMCSS
jgi:hypothetical protein